MSQQPPADSTPASASKHPKRSPLNVPKASPVAEEPPKLPECADDNKNEPRDEDAPIRIGSRAETQAALEQKIAAKNTLRRYDDLS